MSLIALERLTVKFLFPWGGVFQCLGGAFEKAFVWFPTNRTIGVFAVRPSQTISDYGQESVGRGSILGTLDPDCL